MILVGNQRGGGRDLALHLMKDENEHVELYQFRGFASDTLLHAFQESYAISRATKCTQHLFSLSLNPPAHAEVSNEAFEAAIEKAEQRLGLVGQPRAIVFHEKKGMDGNVRRHAHAVWCRIDTGPMKAIQLSHSKNKLMEVSRELYIEHGWKMPPGMLDKRNRDPRNFTLEEWQQAKRAKIDPKELKGLIQDCWAQSDGRSSFANALKEQGYILARGDRRGYVAVDYQGEAYSISRALNLKARQVKDRLGEPEGLPNTQEAQSIAANIIATRLKELKSEQQRKAEAERHRAIEERARLKERQKAQEEALKREQALRQAQEQAARRARIRGGVLGFMDRFTGKRRKIEDQNKVEASRAVLRDRAEHERQKAQQLAATKNQAATHQAVQTRHKSIATELSQDIERLSQPPMPEPVQENTPTRRRKPRGSPARGQPPPDAGPPQEPKPTLEASLRPELSEREQRRAAFKGERKGKRQSSSQGPTKRGPRFER